MHDHLLPDIGKSIVAAAALGLPAYLLGIPLLLAYLAAGVILGPHLGLGVVKSAQSISTLSEIGLVLLMFILGLEIDLRKLLQAGRAVLINGVTQFVLCAGLALVFFKLMGFDQTTGQYGLVYLSVACSLSSTLLVVKILSDRMELDSLTSRITLGILVLQDLWAIGFLAVQPNLSDLDLGSVALSVGKAALLVVASWSCAKFVLPRVFKRASKHPELMLIIVMAWCFAMCGLADALALSLEMGALIAGISIASFPYHVDVAAKVASLRDFFITLFFVGLGLQIPMPTHNVLWISGGIIAFVLVSRVLTVFPVLHLLKYGNRASLIPALNLSQLSEFALVLAALGVAYGHLNQDLLSAFTISMVVTALISSVTIPSGHKLYRFLTKWLEKIGFHDHEYRENTDESATERAPKVIFLGFHREASSLLHEMLTRYPKKTESDLMIVDFNPEAHRQLKERGIRCQYGDISHVDTLRHLDLHEAKLLVCTIPDQLLKGTSNLRLLRNLKEIAPKARVIVTAERLDMALELYGAGAAYVFIPRMISAPYLADVMERMQSDTTSNIRKSATAYIRGRKEIIP